MNDNSESTRSFAMADVSAKAVTHRRALAVGAILIGPDAFQLLKEDGLPKGDPRPMAEIAGTQAAKATPTLLPLCHPISLIRASVHTVLDEERYAVVVYCLAEIAERTGVEMEALTGASVALLTIWDLVKPVNPALEVDQVKLLYKSGGKKGEWIHPDGLDATSRDILGLDQA